MQQTPGQLPSFAVIISVERWQEGHPAALRIEATTPDGSDVDGIGIVELFDTDAADRLLGTVVRAALS